MSDNKGSFDFTGSFGDFCSYDDPGTGKRIISKKGGPTPEQFRNDPKYAQAWERFDGHRGGALPSKQFTGLIRDDFFGHSNHTSLII